MSTFITTAVFIHFFQFSILFCLFKFKYLLFVSFCNAENDSEFCLSCCKHSLSTSFIGICTSELSNLEIPHFKLEVLHQVMCEYEPAYLKVCTKSMKQSFDSTYCTRRIWLKQPIEPGCLCVRGVWAVTNGYCDEHAAILVGDGHCFNIPFKIIAAKLIGDPKDPFKPKINIAPDTLDAFVEVREGNFTEELTSDSTILIGVNPRQVAQRRDYQLCVDLEPKDYGKPVHVYINQRRVSKEWILNRKREFSCPSVDLYQHHVAFGEMYTIHKVHPKRYVERKCQHECLSQAAQAKTLFQGRTESQENDGRQESFSMRGRTMGGVGDLGEGHSTEVTSAPPTKPARTPRLRGVGMASSSNAQLPHLLVKIPANKVHIKTIQERMLEREEMRANATEETEIYETEVNSQTLRMMHAHIRPILLGIPGPKVVTREYRYFQYIRLIAEKACPEEYVPKLLVQGLIRMFRQLLWETQDQFQHLETNDFPQFNRTLNRLSECIEKTTDPSVLYASYNESWDPKDNMTYPKPERCSIPLLYAINGTEYNRTTHKMEPRYLRNYTYFFPPHLKWNSSQVDFVIECAWKITMIGHYRCSKYFDDETAIDFSHFFHHVQSFFNQRIIKRWYYQRSVNATSNIVKMMFPSYDLKKFMFGLDSCLIGTQGFSQFDYSNVWIQRPKIPHTENDLNQKIHIIPGSPMSKLSTRDYAPDPTPPPKPKQEEIVTHSFMKKKMHVVDRFRGKRETEGEEQEVKQELHFYNMWNNRATCLEHYLEPLYNKNFGYHFPSHCHPPF